MQCYRIMTEEKNYSRLMALVSSRFDCFTVYRGLGYWRGASESSLTIEVIDIDGTLSDGNVEGLARAIKRLNKQDAVLVTVSDIEGKLV